MKRLIPERIYDGLVHGEVRLYGPVRSVRSVTRLKLVPVLFDLGYLTGCNDWMMKTYCRNRYLGMKYGLDRNPNLV